ncbi:MAG: cytochrome c [Bacteroidota bacterium]
MRTYSIIASLLLLIAVMVSCQNEQQVEYNRYYSAGAAVYQTHCQNCHSDKGQGLAALIPPLTDSIYLKINKKQLACYLQNGLSGKITVNHIEFDSKMPAAGLSPIEVAQVLTYITNSFGNNGGLVNTEDVERDLKKCK